MYESFFGFTEQPFLTTPQLRGYFATEQVENALQTIISCVERGAGPAMVIASTGTGKTTLVLKLQEHFAPKTPVAVLSGTNCRSPRSLLQNALFATGLPYVDMDEGQMRLSLTEFFKSRAEAGSNTLLLMDDADALSTDLLEELLGFSSLTGQNGWCVPMVLIGSFRLEESLGSPRVASLNQRIAARCYIDSWARSEVEEYVRSRIEQTMTSPSEVFLPDSIRKLYEITAGVPRVVNQLCDHALVMAASKGQRQIDEFSIDEAWSDLQRLPLPAERLESSTIIAKDEFATETVLKANVNDSSIVEFGSLDDETNIAESYEPTSETEASEYNESNESDLDADNHGDEIQNQNAAPFNGYTDAEPNLIQPIQPIQPMDPLDEQPAFETQSDPFAYNDSPESSGSSESPESYETYEWSEASTESAASESGAFAEENKAIEPAGTYEQPLDAGLAADAFSNPSPTETLQEPGSTANEANEASTQPSYPEQAEAMELQRTTSKPWEPGAPSLTPPVDDIEPNYMPATIAPPQNEQYDGTHSLPSADSPTNILGTQPLNPLGTSSPAESTISGYQPSEQYETAQYAQHAPETHETPPPRDDLEANFDEYSSDPEMEELPAMPSSNAGDSFHASPSFNQIDERNETGDDPSAQGYPSTPNYSPVSMPADSQPQASEFSPTDESQLVDNADSQPAPRSLPPLPPPGTIPTSVSHTPSEPASEFNVNPFMEDFEDEIVVIERSVGVTEATSAVTQSVDTPEGQALSEVLNLMEQQRAVIDDNPTIDNPTVNAPSPMNAVSEQSEEEPFEKLSEDVEETHFDAELEYDDSQFDASRVDDTYNEFEELSRPPAAEVEPCPTAASHPIEAVEPFPTAEAQTYPSAEEGFGPVGVFQRNEEDEEDEPIEPFGNVPVQTAPQLPPFEQQPRMAEGQPPVVEQAPNDSNGGFGSMASLPENQATFDPTQPAPPLSGNFDAMPTEQAPPPPLPVPDLTQNYDSPPMGVPRGQVSEFDEEGEDRRGRFDDLFTKIQDES